MRYPEKLFERNLILPGWGELSLASLQWALISGVLLIPAFNPFEHAFESVTNLISINLFGHYLHSFHSYAGDIFLIATALHIIEYLYKKSFLSYRFKSWFYLTLLTAVSVMVVFTGFLSIGSLESFSALAIFKNILAELSALGKMTALFLINEGKKGSTGVIYLHHAATFSIVTIILTYIHIRRLSAARYALIYGFCLISLMALIQPAAIGRSLKAYAEVVKGPWYFIGLQEMLTWQPAIIAGIIFPLLTLILFSLLPIRKLPYKLIIWLMTILVVFYILESLAGTFLRGV